MKIRIMSILCVTLLLCCGCGREREVIGNAGADVLSGNTAVTMPEIDTDIYFDTSDLTYVGKYEQRLAIGYDVENKGCSKPVLVFDEYTSSDGEIFRFDDQGRLVHYMNKEDILFDSMPASIDGEPSTRENEKLRNRAVEVFDSCVKVRDYTLSSYGEDIYYLKKASEGIGNPIHAQVKLTADGQVRSYKVSYNTLTVEVTEAYQTYFEKKLQDYIAEIGKRYKIQSYVPHVRYEQVGNTLYALYTCDFTETDGAMFAEAVCFSKEILQSADEAV